MPSINKWLWHSLWITENYYIYTAGAVEWDYIRVTLIFATLYTYCQWQGILLQVKQNNIWRNQKSFVQLSIPTVLIGSTNTTNDWKKLKLHTIIYRSYKYTRCRNSFFHSLHVFDIKEISILCKLIQCFIFKQYDTKFGYRAES